MIPPSRHGSKPWTTHSNTETHGGMGMEQKLQPSTATTSLGCEVQVSLLIESNNPSLTEYVLSLKMKESQMQLLTELCQQFLQSSITSHLMKR
jgi:hypothetical protein